MSILLKDIGWVVTQDPGRRVLRQSSIYVEGSTIRAIGKDIRPKAETVIDCRRFVALPGLVNAHTHLSMTLMRGYADDMLLHEWLTKKIWPTEARLTPDAAYAGALLGCLEMIMTGTTTFVDMYFYMEEVARAVADSGLRAVLGYGIIDALGAERMRRKAVEFVNYVKALKHPMILAAIMPHAPYTCSEETLLWAKEAAEKADVLLHIHLAETRAEQAEFEKKHGMGVIEYLDRIGFLSPRVLGAHCVWLSRGEVKVMASRGVKAVHCPVSNMKLASGGALPLPEMLENGVTVSLGTDGAASNNCLDMFETMKAAALLQRFYRWDGAFPTAQEVLDMATINGAKALGLQDRIGSIEVGKEADIILLDASAPNLSPIADPQGLVWSLVYSASGHNVDTTIASGRVLMLHRRPLSLDPEAVYARAQEEALRLTGAS